MFKKPFVLALLIFTVSVFLSFSTSSALECINSKFLFDITPGADQPSDLALGPYGNIYIVDGVNNRIIVVDSNGRWKFAFGSMGSGKGQLRYPLGIDISEKGKIFIADTGNHRIQVFDLKGHFIYMFDVKTESDMKPPDPVDVIASSLRDYLYVSDNDNHSIKIYKQDGTYVSKWGNFGEGQGEFRYPATLAKTSFNEILAVDVLNTRVQKFDPFGKFIAEIGSWGILPGSLFRPKGVAVNKKDRVFVSDSYMGVIQVFTDLGGFLGVLCENNKKIQFNTPVGITIDNKKRLLVVEMRSNKVSVWKILEQK